jgi:hypothetical protein
MTRSMRISSRMLDVPSYIVTFDCNRTNHIFGDLYQSYSAFHVWAFLCKESTCWSFTTAVFQLSGCQSSVESSAVGSFSR